MPKSPLAVLNTVLLDPPIAREVGDYTLPPDRDGRHAAHAPRRDHPPPGPHPPLGRVGQPPTASSWYYCPRLMVDAVVTGSAGMLGQALMACVPDGVAARGVTRADGDLASPAGVASAIEAHAPALVV